MDDAKIYNFIPRDAYFAFADEAKHIGLPFAGHVPAGVKASEASEAGQRSIEHAGFTNVGEECSAHEDEIRRRIRAEFESDEPQLIPIRIEAIESYDTLKCNKVFDTFIKNSTWGTPTLLVGGMADSKQIRKGWREDQRLRYLTKEVREWMSMVEEGLDAMGGNPGQEQIIINFQRGVTLAMHQAGVSLLAGSDPPFPGVFPGFSLHDELKLLAKIGQLYLQDGVWNGKQLISKSWIDQSFLAHREATLPKLNESLRWEKDGTYGWGYNNYWWIPDDTNGYETFAWGSFGQTIYINKLRNVVVVSFRAEDRDGKYQDFNFPDRSMLDFMQAIANSI